MEHSFNVEVAAMYGMNAAVILNNLAYWIEKNKANNENFYDGHHWTYNSVSAFKKLFPYLTERQISYAIKKLQEEELIVTGNYNKSAYDRTMWYAITKKGYSILHHCQMENTTVSNRNDADVEPIPDINTNSKPDSKPDVFAGSAKKKKFVKPTVDEIQAYCLERDNGIDPQYFFDSNEAKGWVVGKNRTPMQDWKATVRTWEKNQKKGGEASGYDSDRGDYGRNGAAQAERPGNTGSNRPRLSYVAGTDYAGDMPQTE